MEINRLIANLQQETVALDGVNKSTAQLIGNISLELIKASKSIPELNNNITNVNNQLNSTNDTIEKSITGNNFNFSGCTGNVYVKYNYFNMSVSDIARGLSMSESAVKTRLSRIRADLKVFLSERGVEV